MKHVFNSLPILFLLGALLASSCDKSDDEENPEIVFTYDFSNGFDGWTANYADYPVEGEGVSDPNFKFERIKLTEPLDITKYALNISGNNFSDDIFLFIKRKFDGLEPNTTYILVVDVDFVGQATGFMGVGGAPAENTYLKAGICSKEPDRIVDNSSIQPFYIMNIDKGNQAKPGVDMDTIGHVGGKHYDEYVPEIICRSNKNNKRQFEFTTNSNADAWGCVGIDSGHEGGTGITITNLTFRLRKK